MMSAKTYRLDRPATIAIVGSGFSGTMTAVNLARLGMAGLRVLLFERGKKLARGAAYDSGSKERLLNVPARLMSAFPDRPDHFIDWLHARDPEIDPSAFVSRSLYGEYLESLLRDARRKAGSRLSVVLDQVVDAVEEPTGRLTLKTDQGCRYEADAMVLALGNPPPHDFLNVPDGLRTNGCYHNNPWSADPFEGLDPADPVVIVGTGLTMIDLVLESEARGRTGPITAISRHGLLPQPHRAVNALAAPLFPSDDRPATLLELFRVIRSSARRVEQSGGDWRAVIDALRPETQALWKSLSVVEKERFLRHLAVHWDTHRHRVSARAHEILATAREEGRLSILAARVQTVEADGADGLRITAQTRSGRSSVSLAARRLINCTGSSRSLRESKDPLLASLCRSGLACQDELGMGLKSDGQGRLLSENGSARRIHTIGPVRKGDLWETTAVRELRQQAADLAVALRSEFPTNRAVRPHVRQPAISSEFSL